MMTASQLDRPDEISIPAHKLRVGMTLVSPVTGRHYIINELERFSGTWIKIDSESPCENIKHVDEHVSVLKEDHEF